MAGYIFFLLANAMLLMRPAEWIPWLGDAQLYMACMGLALLFSLNEIFDLIRTKSLLQQPVTLCVIGVTCCVVTSRIFTGHITGIDRAFFGMAKVAMYYLVLVAVIRTPQRLRIFLMSTAICATVMIAYSVMDYRSFNAEWLNNPNLPELLERERKLPPHERVELRHIPDRDGVDRYGNEIWFFRICGLGIFQDPNDLSLLIVVVCIISIYFLTDPKQVGVRYLWVIPLVIMATAMYYTYSRGGLLAGGVGLLVWLSTKYGGKVAITIGALGAAAVPLVLGRMGNIDLSSGTGQQRVQLWSDGLMAIRNSRILFGIGEDQYADVAGHVAHNSYVHAFVELGFFGGMFFFGCFFLPAFTFLLMKIKGFHIENPELRRLYPYVVAILANWCMGMCSLSRCYVPPTYMIAGLCAAYINLVGFYRSTPRPLLVLNHRTIQPWFACTCGLLLGAYLFVRVFARFG